MLIWNPKIQRSLWQLNQMAHPITADSRFWVPTAFDSLAIPKISQPLDVLFRKCSHLLKRHETALSGREIHLAATTFKYFQIKLDWKLQNHFIFPSQKMFIHSKLKHKTLPVKSSVPVKNGSITIFWILWSKVTGIGLRELYFSGENQPSIAYRSLSKLKNLSF